MQLRGPTALSIASVFAALVLLVWPGPVTAQSSTEVPWLADARAGHTATLLEDERVLVAGGTDGRTELARVESVDPASMTVETLGSLLRARSGHTATPLSDGRVLIAGGETDGTSLADAELFDPASGTSEPVGAMTWARTGHAAALLGDGRVLLVGGTDGDKPVARAELFDPARSTFEPAAKSKAAHRDATATVLPFGTVLVAGKATRNKAPAAELYDPASDTWAAVKKAPGLTGHSATELRDGRALLVGGSAGKGQLFDLASGVFVQGPALAAERSGHTATALLFGEVLIVGGEQAGAEVATVELFDIERDSFQAIGEMMIPRTGHTTTALPDGRALVVGGTSAGLVLDDVLVYDPDTQQLEPLGGVVHYAEPTAGARTRAGVHAELGAPDAFVMLYPDWSEPDAALSGIETWTYFEAGTEFTFDGGNLVGEDSIEPTTDVLATPYDPNLFEAYMTLDEVLAAAGIEEYFGGPMDEEETTELYFAEQLAWGLKDGALHFIEGIALGAEGGTEETR